MTAVETAIQINTTAVLRAWDDSPLPPFPAGVDFPTVTYEFYGGQLYTWFFWVAGHAIQFWTVGDETHNEHGFGPDPLGALDDASRDMAYEWMRAVHDRVDCHAYTITLAAHTDEAIAAVVALSLTDDGAA